MSLFRILLGLVALALLIPAAALYSDSGMSPWAEAQASPPSSEGADQAPGSGRALGKGETEPIGEKGSPLDHSKGKGHQHSTDESSPTTTSSTTTSTTGRTATTSTTTSTSTTSTTTASSDQGSVDDVITGDACPCTVTGSVELKGSINLKGDLMVHGGTLIARPGVDLNGNGFQIMFMDGGRADFQGSPVFTWSGDGSNANLKRDINLRNLRRIMFHQGAGPSVLKYFTVSDSGTSTLGDYPLHWHLNGNTTRGTIVEGVVVINGKHHAFVPHGSHGITFKDTIAKDGKCDAYWWDPPEFQSTSTTNNSNDIVYDRALADGVTNCATDNRGFRLSAFHLGAGSGNVITNSAARNVNPSHPKDCSGFHWPELHHQQPTTWTFRNNASYGSSCNGIFVWQNNTNEHIIDGFRGDGIDHGAYVNHYDYRNITVPFVEIHALGWSVTGGAIGHVKARRHALEGRPVVFTDVQIDRFIIDNANDGGSTPGEYVLSNTGLTCASIEYVSVVPGTKVWINGAEC